MISCRFRNAILRYLDRGWSPIPVLKGTNRPTFENWRDGDIINEDNIDEHFDEVSCNIGVVLGEASGGLVSVEVAAHGALLFAEELLPPTRMIFGPASNNRTHWIYRVSRPIVGYQRRNPQGKVVLDIRGTGQFTIFPPSLHESGEPIIYQSDDEPSSTSRDRLVEGTLAIQLAICSNIPAA